MRLFAFLLLCSLSISSVYSKQELVLPGFSGVPELVQIKLKDRYMAVKSSRSAATLGEYGLALHANGYKKKAIESYIEAVKVAPDEAKWTALAAVALFEESRLEDALRYIRQSNESGGGNASSLFMHARLLEEIGEYDEALKIYIKAHKIKPFRAATNFSIARIYMVLEEYEKATPYMLNAVKKAPDSAVIRSALLRLSKVVTIDNAIIPDEEMAQNELPIELPSPYLENITAEGVRPEILRYSISRHIEKGDLEKALTITEDLVKYYKDSMEESDWVDYAFLLSGLSRFEEAKAVYEDALKLSDSYIVVRQGLADLLFRERRYSDAKKHYLKLLNVGKLTGMQKGRVLQGLGRLAIVSGNYPRGLRLMKQASVAWPESGEVRLDLAKIYADMGEGILALDFLKQASSLGAHVPPAMKAKLEWMFK